MVALLGLNVQIENEREVVAGELPSKYPLTRVEGVVVLFRAIALCQD